RAARVLQRSNVPGDDLLAGPGGQGLAVHEPEGGGHAPEPLAQDLADVARRAGDEEAVHCPTIAARSAILLGWLPDAGPGSSPWGTPRSLSSWASASTPP